VPWVSLRFAYQQHPLEAVMGGLEPVTKIEAMSIGTHLIARQLNAVTTSLSDPIDREFEQLTADTLGPEIRVDVEGLDLGAQTALGLEVTEHDHLADTHDQSAGVGYEQIPVLRGLDLSQCDLVALEVLCILFPRRQRTQRQKLHDPGDVLGLGTSDREVRHAGRLSAVLPPAHRQRVPALDYAASPTHSDSTPRSWTSPSATT